MAANTTFPCLIVNAFTTGNNDPFTGGPAAIVLLKYDDEISDEAKVNLAKDMNLSETAFVALAWTKTEGETLSDVTKSKVLKCTLRWFTPAYEVPICGHATAAAAKAVLRHYQKLQCTNDLVVEQIQFETKFVGTLTADLTKENNAEIITLDLPAAAVEKVDIKNSQWVEDLLKPLLGSKFTDVLDLIDEIHHSPTRKHYLLLRLKPQTNETPAETIVKVEPNYDSLLAAKSGELDSRLFMVTMKGEEGIDYYCRIFAPHYGVKEDPVCGSAQCLLVPYWTNELEKEGEQLLGRQMSPSGGLFRAKLVGDRITLGGTCRVVIEGEFNYK